MYRRVQLIDKFYIIDSILILKRKEEEKLVTDDDFVPKKSTFITVQVNTSGNTSCLDPNKPNHTNSNRINLMNFHLFVKMIDEIILFILI